MLSNDTKISFLQTFSGLNPISTTLYTYHVEHTHENVIDLLAMGQAYPQATDH